MISDKPRLTRQNKPPKAGIIHLGLGAFFRSFGAIFVEEAIAEAGGDWGIIGVSLQSFRIRNSLAPQGNIYSAVELDPKEIKTRVVEVIGDVIFAPENRKLLLERLADPAIKIVSLTVTEKGYCHIPSTGFLDLQHPDIEHDIEQQYPRSAIGFIVRALGARMSSGLRPFTVLSCDNLPNNGHVVRNVVLGFAEAIDPELSRWIASEGRFPSTMVDRIVPATTYEDIENLAARAGYFDECPVVHEPFRQWVIEDNFVDGQRPEFECIQGVELVQNVAPFELMKIRMLNGTHSALAYLGYLAGHQTIACAMADPDFARFIKELWAHEIIPSLQPPKGVDLRAYAGELFDRYSNTNISHKTWQIAMDGSQKLPQRILGSISDNLDQGRRSEGLMLAVAAWMIYVGGIDEKGQLIDVRDPLGSKLRNLSDAGKTTHDKVKNLLSVRAIFDQSLATRISGDLIRIYRSLKKNGSRESLKLI